MTAGRQSKTSIIASIISRSVNAWLRGRKVRSFSEILQGPPGPGLSAMPEWNAPGVVWFNLRARRIGVLPAIAARRSHVLFIARKLVARAEFPKPPLVERLEGMKVSVPQGLSHFGFGLLAQHLEGI